MKSDRPQPAPVCRVSDEVLAALADGRPVVGLETAVVTAGLPAAPIDERLAGRCTGWNAQAPANLEAWRLMERAVRAGGAIPATVAARDGWLDIGLDEAALIEFAETAAGAKVSAGGLGACLATRRPAGTTVSAALAACGLAGIAVMATGGIGGVHRGWTSAPDVSADLLELSRTACCVVASGAKLVLDIAATREALEALQVAVVGYRTNRFPAFYSAGSDALAPIERVVDAATVASICISRWQSLRQRGAVLLANPVPEHAALPQGELESLIDDLVDACRRDGIVGAAVTPALLAGLTERTSGRTLTANLALLESNARLAAEVAVALTAEFLN